MQVSRSRFYPWRLRDKSKRAKEHERLTPKAKAIHTQAGGSYGARRISEELTAAGEPYGHAKATTRMRLAKVTAKQKKRFKATTNSKHNLPVAPNLLKRNFAETKPNSTYCSDITYIWTTEGWLYLEVVIDLFSRKVVGRSIDKLTTRKLVVSA